MRYRNREGVPISGNILYFGGNNPQSVVPFYDTSADVIGNRSGDNPLDLTHSHVSGCIIDYEPSRRVKYTSVGSAAYNHSNFSLLSLSSPSSYVNRLLAGSGPLTPKVNLPLFVFELKDIPRMLKHAGDLLHKIRNGPSGLSPAREGASATLAYQFGWRPLMDDLSKLMDFSELVEKRQRELRKAHSEKGLRRRLTLDQGSIKSEGNFTHWSTYGLTVNSSYTQNLSFKVWGTVRWTVRDPSLYGREPSYKDAFRSALGLNRGMIPINVWKALPWSWLVDWFAGISDLMLATYNMVFYRPTSACIMQTSEGVRVYSEHRNGSVLVMSNGRHEKSKKTRTVFPYPSASITLRLPFLDNFKLSILGSLAILRLSGR